MFKNRLAREKWNELMDASKAAPVIPPCQNTDPEIWFPENLWHSGDNFNTVKIAKDLCNQCPVKNLCLEFALINDEEYGIWGGTSVRQRDILRGKRPSGGK